MVVYKYNNLCAQLQSSYSAASCKDGKIGGSVAKGLAGTDCAGDPPAEVGLARFPIGTLDIGW